MARVAGQTQDVVGLNAVGEPEAEVVTQIERCARRLNAQALLRRLIALFTCGALFPLLMVVGDHVCPEGLPRWILHGAALTWIITLFLLALVLAVITLVRRLNPLFAAQFFERRTGIEYNSIVNALLLRHAPEGSYAYEAALRQAAGDIRTHPADNLSEPGTLRASLGLAALVVGVWLVYAFVSPKAVGPSVARFFGADWPAPTATHLEWLHPGPDEVVHAGDELRIEVAVHGRAASEARFDVLDPYAPSAAPASRHTFRPEGHGSTDRWYLTLAPHEVTRDIRYRCSAGDDSLTGVIRVEPQPTIVREQIVLDPPAYTGWPTETVVQPGVDVLVGTWATFRVQANVEVRQPELVLVGERETRTAMAVAADDPAQFSLPLQLLQSAEYRIEFCDRWGYRLRNPPQHRLAVRPDAPPTVEIVIPTQEEAPDDVVDVKRFTFVVAVATDDVRVARLTFVTEQNGLEHRAEVEGATEVGGRKMRGRVETGSLLLKPGESLRAWFEVRDHRVLPDGRAAPQMAKSRVLTLTRPADPPPHQGSPPTGPGNNPGPDGDGAGSDVREGEPTKGADGANGKQQESDASEKRQDAGEPEAGPEPAAAGGQEERQTPAKAGTAQGEKEPLEDDAAQAGAGPTKAGTERAEDKSAEGGEGERASAGARSGRQEFEREVKRFVKEHGEMAREVGRSLRRGDDAAKPDAERSGKCEGATEKEGAGTPKEAGNAAGSTEESSSGQERAGDSSGEAEKSSKAEAQGSQQGGSKPEEQAKTGDGAKQGQCEGGKEGSAGASGGKSSTGKQGGGAQAPEGAGQGQCPDGKEGAGAGSQAKSSASKQGADSSSNGAGESPKEGSSESGQAGSKQGGDPAGDASNKGGPAAGGGGGHTDGGTAEGRGGQGPEPPEPLPDAPEAVPTGDAPLESEGLVETIDLLKMLQRGEGISEDQLVESGWLPAQAAAFVKALERVYDAARKSGLLDELQHVGFGATLGDARVQLGQGLAGDAKTAIGPVQPARDTLRRIAPPAEQKVPRHLRALLEAYYRSLAEQRAHEHP
jgi:hypothetical protein